MKYLPFELHNHTRHSDGRFLTGELLRSCAAYGYRGAALTDHNVFTAVGEVTPELLAETGMIVIPGIEWTTFYGHLLVLGCKRYVDWRFVTPGTIDHALMEIREAGGIAGIAHPCEVGAPLMCGCHWDFKVTRWDLVSYVEVWSEENPHKRTKNALALPWYDALLNAGHRLGVSAGRDWHAADSDPSNPPLLTATCLGMESEDTGGAMAALREGRSLVTLGPVSVFSVKHGDRIYGLGESVPAGEISAAVGLDSALPNNRAWEVKPECIRLVMNGRTVAELPCGDGRRKVSLTAASGWLRMEVWGTYRESQGERMLALTSPIYVEESP